MAFTPLTVGNQKGAPTVSFTPLDTPTPKVEPAGASGVSGVAVGALKGVGQLARDVGGFGNFLQQNIARGLENFGVQVSSQAAGEESVFNSSSEAGKKADEALSSHGAAEKVGDIGVDVATFFVPGAKATQLAGRITSGVGNLASKFGIGISSKEAPLIQMYRAQVPLWERMANLLKGERPSIKPTTNRETALTKNIFGTESMIGVQAQRGATHLWNDIIDPALSAAQTKINMPQFIDEMAAEIEQIAELSRKGELKQALEAFKHDYKDVAEVTVKQLQQFKEGWAEFLPDKVYKGKSVGNAFKEIQNIAANLARTKIYQDLGGAIRAAYLDYGNLKNLQKLGQTALTESKLKGGAGSFLHGVKDMLLTPIASTAGLVLYKTGKGLEFVGTAGLKKVGDLFGF